VSDNTIVTDDFAFGLANLLLANSSNPRGQRAESLGVAYKIFAMALFAKYLRIGSTVKHG